MFNAGVAVEYLEGYFNLITKMGYVKSSFQWRYMLYLFLIDFTRAVGEYLTEEDYKKIRLLTEQLFSDGGCLFPYPLICCKEYSHGKAKEKCSPVVISATGDMYSESRTVTLSCETEDSVIHYTTDGSDPKTSQTAQVYSSPIVLSTAGTTTIKAYSSKEDFVDSDVVTSNIPVKKLNSVVISATGDQFSESRTIIMTCESDGVEIHYTLDDSVPTINSPVYDPSNKPVITETTTVKAFAVKTGWTDSALTQATFTITSAGGDVYYGYSTLEVMTEAGITALPGHRETLNPAGDYTAYAEVVSYLWICIDPSQTIVSVTSNIFPIPMDEPIIVGGYKCYRSQVMHRGNQTCNFTVHT